MRVLVTGASGFAGRYLCRELVQSGHTPVLYNDPRFTGPDGFEEHTGDISNETCLHSAVQAASPDACIHLAGQSFVPAGWEDPAGMYNTNLLGTVRLLEVFRKTAPSARILVVTSSEIYGRTPAENPIDETAPFQPENVYGVSKAAADFHAQICARHYDQPVMIARPGNHIGPGQSSQFVTSAFAQQLALLRESPEKPGVMKVGNLKSIRNFTDVRDVVRGYRLLIEHGEAGNAYNLAAPCQYSIQNILDMLCSAAGFTPDIQIDPDLYRPADARPILNTTRIQHTTGWEARQDIKTTLNEILEDAQRNREAT